MEQYYFLASSPRASSAGRLSPRVSSRGRLSPRVSSSSRLSPDVNSRGCLSPLRGRSRIPSCELHRPPAARG
jgi:hypothetical protein